MKPRLACDIDGVIFNVVPEYVKEINRRTGKNYHCDDLHEYSFEKAWGLDKGLVWECIDAVLRRETQKVYAGVRLLNMIAILVDTPIFFLTARRPEFRDVTIRQLQNLYTFPFMVFLRAESKGAYCRVGGIDYMIEDSPHHAEEITEKSPITTVILMKRSYNIGIKHPRVKYVNNMWELLIYFIRRKHAKSSLPASSFDLSGRAEQGGNEKGSEGLSSGAYPRQAILDFN